eukprot:3334339-Heterocapsa_arctica.AAC.1
MSHSNGLTGYLPKSSGLHQALLKLGKGGTGLKTFASCAGTHYDVLECGMFARGNLPQGQATTIGWDPRTGIAQVH